MYMTEPVHRDTDSRTCGASTTVSLQPNVFANNLLVAVNGDPNSHGDGGLIAGANNVFANNILVVRIVDGANADSLCPPLGGDHCAPDPSSASGNVFAGFPTAVDLGGGTVGYFLPPQPAQEPNPDEPEATKMTAASPGGGAIAPSTDGGPVVAQGSSEELKAEEILPPPGGATGQCARPDLGKVSERYESNGNPSAIGFDTTGGWSWGAYQIATKVGTFKNYMTFCKQRYPDIHSELESVGGNSAYTAGGKTSPAATKWKELKDHPNFVASQHDFIQATHFDKMVAKIKKATGLDICDGTHCYGLQDAIWSISVQHGPGSSIPKKGIAAAGPDANDCDIINAIYDERDRVDVYFKRSTPGVKAGVAKRFKRERADCLALCPDC